MPNHKMVRYNYEYKVEGDTTSAYSGTLVNTGKQKGPNPFGKNQPLFGGSAYIVATREFINWTMTNKTVQQFINWTSDTYSPDEMVWATLTRIQGAPGYRNPHSKWDQNELQTVTRIVKWNTFDGSVYPPCTGYYNRGICVYGIGDIGWVRHKTILAIKLKL